jgi:sugar phosphate isomerase/epimerase
MDWGRMVPIGSGQVDFQEFLIALNAVGYSGPLAIEQESDRRRVEDVRATIDFLKSLDVHGN